MLALGQDVNQTNMNTEDRIKFLTEALDLRKHPEGGYFKEVYRSKDIIPKSALSPTFSGDRNCGTSIYFLLTSASFSSFHKIRQDETWHFYEGSSIALHVISPEEAHSMVKVGSQLNAGDKYQFTVPAEHWFAAKIIEEDSYALVGCTVSPVFDFDDFTLGNRQELVSLYPEHSAIIESLTYP